MRKQYNFEATPQYQSDNSVLDFPSEGNISRINFKAVEKWVFRQLSELSPALTYHGKHHTSGVLAVAKYLCVFERINRTDALLVKTAALFHDIGFLFTYKNHEAKGCEVVRETLPNFGYSAVQIEKICELIMATRVPQSPQCRLAEILCDADLDYLGRDDYAPVSASLVREWENFGIMPEPQKWLGIQIQFLESHQFFTPSSRRMRQKTKQKQLEKLKKMQ